MENSTLNKTSTPESAPAKEPWITPVLLYLSRGDDAVNKIFNPLEQGTSLGPS